MRSECAAAVPTGTDADQPHPEEARWRRLEGRGVRTDRRHKSYAMALRTDERVMRHQRVSAISNGDVFSGDASRSASLLRVPSHLRAPLEASVRGLNTAAT